MTTKVQDKKGQAAKAPAKQTPTSKPEAKASNSIGFLRAAEKAHIAVMDIPLDFFADLGMFPEKVKSTKDLCRRFIGGMYRNLDGASTRIGDVVTAPAKLMRALSEKVQKEAETAKAKAKATTAESKAKSSQTKVKQVAPKAKAKAKVRAKDAVKSKAKSAKPKARSKAAKGAKAAKKVVKIADLPNPTGIH